MKTNDDAYLVEHTKKVIRGEYPPLQSPPTSPGQLISYRLDQCGITYPDCLECRKAGEDAGRTNVYCQDHALYLLYCEIGQPIDEIDWKALEEKLGKVRFKLWKDRLAYSD